MAEKLARGQGEDDVAVPMERESLHSQNLGLGKVQRPALLGGGGC